MHRVASQPGTTVRVLFLDYSKAFDLINHETLINKRVAMNLPAHIVRWMAAFLLDREQTVKIGASVIDCITTSVSQWRCPTRNVVGAQELLVYINDLRTPCSIYKYVDDSTVFEICNPINVSVLAVAHRGVSGPWGPQFCGALCNVSQLGVWGRRKPPQRGPWQSPGGKAFWQQYIENWLKIRYLNWSPSTPNSDPIATL